MYSITLEENPEIQEIDILGEGIDQYTESIFRNRTSKGTGILITLLLPNNLRRGLSFLVFHFGMAAADNFTIMLMVMITFLPTI
jgi:hypothetical protein